VIESFLKALKKSPKSKNVFNPWWQVDPIHDLGPQCPRIRRQQLAQYLRERQGKVKYLLLGEALGYQGGHFSGMAMTSERILLGELKKKGIEPHYVFQDLKPQRTSKPAVKALGFSEPTATIVWGFMMQKGINPFEFVIWNAFPWHPFDPKKGYLSNRTPTSEEMIYGKNILQKLIDLMQVTHIIAIGEKSHALLAHMGFESVKVRHPANGGAGLFRKQMLRFLQNVGHC